MGEIGEIAAQRQRRERVDRLCHKQPARPELRGGEPQRLDERRCGKVLHDLPHEDAAEGSPRSSRVSLSSSSRTSRSACSRAAADASARSESASTSLRTESLNTRWSAASGSTYQRMSFRSTRLANPLSPPPASRSAETGQKRSASARFDTNSAAGEAPAAAPRRSSSLSRSNRAATSISSGEEMPAGAGFFASGPDIQQIVRG